MLGSTVWHGSAQGMMGRLRAYAGLHMERLCTLTRAKRGGGPVHSGQHHGTSLSGLVSTRRPSGGHAQCQAALLEGRWVLATEVWLAVGCCHVRPPPHCRFIIHVM